MFCNQCGSEVKSGAKFCTRCGARLDQPAQQDAYQQEQSYYQQPQPAYQQPQQPGPRDGRKKSHIGLIIGLIIAACIVIAGVAGMLFFLNRGPSIEERLEMGNRYLEDLDYDEAIEVFQEILDIDPKCVDAYMGLADAYIGVEDYESAMDILEKGYDKTEDDDLKERLEEVEVEKESYDRKIRNEKVFAGVEDVFENIAGYCEAGNYDELFEYMQSDDYQRLLDVVDELEMAYCVETSHGNVGIYEVNNEVFGNYMIYYGDYQDDVREGEGDWLGYFEGNNYHARGSWKADAPNGYQEVREWSNRLGETVVYRVIKGDTVDGLWNGPVDWCFEEMDGTTEVYPVTFEEGKWVVLDYDEADETSPYIVCLTGGASGDRKMTTDDVDCTEGIMGFATSY